MQETIDELAARLKLRFELASLIAKLKSQRELPREQQLTKEEQREIWQTIKQKMFAQIMAIAYSHTLIMLALKIQTSLICHESVKRFNSAPQRSFHV